MLNELRDLSRSLIASGIEITDWHPNFDKCPKGGTACFIYLNESGDIKILHFPNLILMLRLLENGKRQMAVLFPRLMCHRFLYRMMMK